MAINELKVGANLTRLESTLLRSSLQNRDPALYQVILNLIRNAQSQINTVQGNASEIDILISSGGAGINELTGDVTAGPGTGSQVATIANNAVTNPKLRDSNALSVIGRSANSTGDPADISAVAASASVLRESGSVLGFGAIATGGITDAAVTYAKIQDVTATQRLLGRNSAGSGDVEEVTISQALDWLT